jgi:hypothetical protein
MPPPTYKLDSQPHYLFFVNLNPDSTCFHVDAYPTYFHVYWPRAVCWFAGLPRLSYIRGKADPLYPCGFQRFFVVPRVP